MPICRANGFLVFPGDAIPPFSKAFNRGSEDGAAIVPDPACRPVTVFLQKAEVNVQP